MANTKDALSAFNKFNDILEKSETPPDKILYEEIYQGLNKNYCINII
jgi:hypothetical protein